MIKESFGFTFGTVINQLMKLLKSGTTDPEERKRVYEGLITMCQQEIDKMSK